MAVARPLYAPSAGHSADTLRVLALGPARRYTARCGLVKKGGAGCAHTLLVLALGPRRCKARCRLVKKGRTGCARKASSVAQRSLERARAQWKPWQREEDDVPFSSIQAHCL